MAGTVLKTIRFHENLKFDRVTRLYVEQVADDHIFMELQTYLEAYPTLFHAFIGCSVM